MDGGGFKVIVSDSGAALGGGVLEGEAEPVWFYVAKVGAAGLTEDEERVVVGIEGGEDEGEGFDRFVVCRDNVAEGVYEPGGEAGEEGNVGEEVEVVAVAEDGEAKVLEGAYGLVGDEGCAAGDDGAVERLGEEQGRAEEVDGAWL